MYPQHSITAHICGDHNVAASGLNNMIAVIGAYSQGPSKRLAKTEYIDSNNKWCGGLWEVVCLSLYMTLKLDSCRKKKCV